jgi:hypothetical protein
MFMLLALLATAPLSPPAEATAGKLRAAIWSDLLLNGVIGNGNRLASLWYNAGNETTRNLHVQDLRCHGGDAAQHCSFALLRDGGLAKVLGEDAPDKLACDAAFIRSKVGDGWEVKHIPPHRAGHSQTMMRCKPIRPE